MTNGHEYVNFSVVVPVFNGAATLRELHDRLVSVMEALGNSFEIIFVDDCSRDESWQTIQSIADSDERTRGLLLLRNSGQGNATIAGMRQARGGQIITLDDDLQNPPEEISKLVEAMDRSPDIDVVFGAPKDKQHAWWRRWGSGIQQFVLSTFLTRENKVQLSSFRLIRRAVAEPLFMMKVPVYAPGILLGMITTNMIDVEVEHHPRALGRGNYSIMRLMRLSIARFLGLSLLPLRMLAMGGLVGVLLSFSFSIVLLFKYAAGSIQVPGWLTLTLLLTFISGFIFLALGIMGECLQSILISSRNVPPYLIRQQTEDPVDPPDTRLGV